MIKRLLQGEDVRTTRGGGRTKLSPGSKIKQEFNRRLRSRQSDDGHGSLNLGNGIETRSQATESTTYCLEEDNSWANESVNGARLRSRKIDERRIEYEARTENDDGLM